MESYSKNYYHRRKNQENNLNNANYTPELTRDFIKENNISYNPWNMMFYQDGKEMRTYLQQNNQCIYSDQPRYYRYYIYYKDGKSKQIAVHRLMWLYFKGDIPEGYVVDHINNNSLDNRLDNLQLLTRSENTKKNSVGRNQLYYQLGAEEYEKRRQATKKKKRQILENKKIHLTNKANAIKRKVNYQVSLGNKLVNKYNERLECTSNWADNSKWIANTELLKQKITEKEILIGKLKAEYQTKLNELDEINKQLNV